MFSFISRPENTPFRESSRSSCKKSFSSGPQKACIDRIGLIVVKDLYWFLAGESSSRHHSLLLMMSDCWSKKSTYAYMVPMERGSSFWRAVECQRSKGSMKMPFTFGLKQGIGFLFLASVKLVSSMHNWIPICCVCFFNSLWLSIYFMPQRAWLAELSCSCYLVLGYGLTWPWSLIISYMNYARICSDFGFRWCKVWCIWIS